MGIDSINLHRPTTMACRSDMESVHEMNTPNLVKKVTVHQGLTLVQSPARRNHLLWNSLGVI